MYVHKRIDAHLLAIVASVLSAKLFDDVDVYYTKILKKLALDHISLHRILKLERKILALLDFRIVLISPQVVGYVLFSSCGPQTDFSFCDTFSSFMLVINNCIAKLMSSDLYFTSKLSICSHELFILMAEQACKKHSIFLSMLKLFNDLLLCIKERGHAIEA